MSLLGAHPAVGDSSAFSFPFGFIFACRLYLVMRSGSIGFKADGVVAEEEDNETAGT